VNKPILEAKGLIKSFPVDGQKLEVLHDVDLTISPGEFVAVRGPSGCGKSTLLHLLGLMSKPSAGEVLVRGRPTAGLRESQRAKLRCETFGFVFQRFNLLSVISGRENVALTLRLRGWPHDPDRIRELLDEVGLGDEVSRKPGALSMGQQQRIAIARALVHDPAVLLADEPTGNLDSETADRIGDLFDRLNRRLELAIVMVTHSEQASARAGRVVTMRDGRMVQT